jgi:hypothetical protein
MLLNRNNDRALKIRRTESFLFVPDEREKNLNLGMDGWSRTRGAMRVIGEREPSTCNHIRVSLNPHVRWLLVIGQT